MIVNIQIDTATPLSAMDLDLLMLLGGVDKPVDSEPEPVAEPAVKAVPAAKKAAAKKAAPKAEPEPDEDDAPKVDPDLKAKAIARASELLSNGERDRVSAALAKVGADRVSNVPAAKFQEFIQELADE
jgi:hypothetical protein